MSSTPQERRYGVQLMSSAGLLLLLLSLSGKKQKPIDAVVH